jgi:hypothetical protein
MAQGVRTLAHSCFGALSGHPIHILLVFVVRFYVLKHYGLDVGGGLPTVARLDLVRTVVIRILQNLRHVVFAPLRRRVVKFRAVVVVPHHCRAVWRYFRNVLLAEARLWTPLVIPIILVHAKAR